MPLPKTDKPIVNITVPSLKKEYKFRTFTVKEEKIMLIAQESGDLKSIQTALLQIINNCSLELNSNQIANLATFDFEWILIQLRANSVSNIVEFMVTNEETLEEETISFNLFDVKINENPKHDNIIKHDDLVMVMRYPRINEIDDNQDTDHLFELLTNCIETVTQGEEVYEMKDFTLEERKEFVEDLPAKAMEGLQKFFETMPNIRHTVKGKELDRTFEGLEIFFL